MSIHDYILDHRGFDWPELLRSWAWLLPRQFTIWIVNRFGDLFIVLGDGTIHMLDVGAGLLKKVAENRDDFGAKLDENDNANDWLMIPLVDRLVESGVTLKERECYSYRQPPVLGGDYTIDNTVVLPIHQHYAAYGGIHELIKDVPDGTEVTFRIDRTE